MDIKRVKATIGSGIDAAAEAITTVVHARDHGRGGGKLAAAAAYDSRHQCVRDGSARWAEADREVGLVIDRLDSGIRAAHRYLEIVG